MSIEERLLAVQCIVSKSCNKEEAQCAYDELHSIIEELRIEVDCPECEGLGYPDFEVPQLHPCPKCEGTGKITKFPESGDRGRII